MIVEKSILIMRSSDPVVGAAGPDKKCCGGAAMQVKNYIVPVPADLACGPQPRGMAPALTLAVERNQRQLGRRHPGLHQQRLDRLRGPLRDTHMQARKRGCVAACERAAKLAPLVVGIGTDEENGAVRLLY